MDIEARTSDTQPSLCPICGRTANNGVPRRDNTTSVTYLDECGHVWSVSWVEVG